MLFKLLATILTGIGGHYLNRRWDKAIFFMCLFVIYLIAVNAFLYYALQNLFVTADDITREFQTISTFAAKASAIGTFVIWIASLAVTFFDSKNKTATTMTKWTPYGIIGATTTSLLSCVILVYSISTVTSPSTEHLADEAPLTLSSAEFNGIPVHGFYEYMYLGGAPADPYTLPAPPVGEGTLKGRFTYQKQPAQGVTLAVVLNAKYRATGIVTNEQGEFSIPLPPGTWTINVIQTEEWNNKPEHEEFTLYYGGEERLSGHRYNRHPFHNVQGYPVEVTSNPDMIHIDIKIKKDIALTWPSPEEEGTLATIDDSIYWEDYPQASHYYVEILELTRDGSTTIYNPVTTRTLSGKTSISLGSLRHIKSRDDKKAEYVANIYAFSADGTLIAEFSDIHTGGNFLMTDGHTFVEDSMDAFYSPDTVANSEEFQKIIEATALNKERLTAVEILIEDKMLDEAAMLLELVESEFAQGEKESLAGYVLALQGECGKSAVMFKKALAINPLVCIPDEYQANCD